jgi:hypothetical protein
MTFYDFFKVVGYVFLSYSIIIPDNNQIKYTFLIVGVIFLNIKDMLVYQKIEEVLLKYDT